MKKRNLLDLVRADIQRTKKPKKSLDNWVIGEEDKHDEIVKQKKENKGETKKLNPLEQEIGEVAQAPTPAKQLNTLNFTKLNKEPEKEQIRILKREYLEVLDKMEEVSKNLKGVESGKSEKSIALERVKKEIKGLKELIREAVVLIPDSSELTLTIDTTSWTVDDIKNDVTAKIANLVNKVRFSEKLIEFETKELNHKNKLLEDELYKARQELRELKQHGIVRQENTDGNAQSHHIEELNNDHVEETVVSRETSNAGFVKKPEPIEKPVSQPTISQPVKQPSSQPTYANHTPVYSEDTPKYLFIDVERYIENLPEESKFVLEIIGKTGVSRNAEMKTFVEQEQRHFFSGDKFLYNDMNSAVKLLKDRQLLDSEQVKLGAKGGYNFAVYELSDIGKAVYYKFTGLQPVESEKQRIIRDHATVEHGYLIKECANSFKEMNYIVYEDRDNCTFKLPDNKRKVFDFIIEKDGKRSHIEVERGTHNEQDFLDAMDKIYQVTNEFYFIAPNEKILYNHTRGNVFKWITKRLGGFEQAKGKVTMYFAKFEDVKKQKKNMWDKFEL